MPKHVEFEAWIKSIKSEPGKPAVVTLVARVEPADIPTLIRWGSAQSKERPAVEVLVETLHPSLFESRGPVARAVESLREGAREAGGMTISSRVDGRTQTVDVETGEVLDEDPEPEPAA